MSKQTPDKSPSEEERESDEEEEDKYAPLHLSPSTELHEYSYHESLDPGPGHASLSRLDMPLSTGGLRTRGPGRPRIHPLKPAGISRPRGRPKGSRNKKPRKRLEKPPKRPRGRPRKWPPEMWEGFQRTRHTVVQQHLKQQQPLHHQHDMPISSHMFMEQSEDPMSGMQGMSSGIVPMQHSLHSPPSHQPSHYMQFPLDPDQPQDLPLPIQHHPLPPELAPQQITGPPLLMPGTDEQQQEALADAEELLWMQQLHPEQRHPPTTTR